MAKTITQKRLKRVAEIFADARKARDFARNNDGNVEYFAGKLFGIVEAYAEATGQTWGAAYDHLRDIETRK